jgi:beta-galactosidase
MDRLEKIRQAGFNLVSTYVPWLWHEPTEGVIDLTGETHPRRNLTKFLELCHDMGMYCIVRPGPYVMSELKNEGIPHWLLDNYPEVIARGSKGEFHPTRVVSYLHPTFLEKVSLWYKAVCEVIAPRLITHGGPVIMFQLDNEIGMLHWVTNTSDYNEATLKEFEQYLQEHYSDENELRKIFGENIRFNTIAEAVRQFASAPESGTLALHWVWGEFWREYRAKYVAVLKDMATQGGIDVPFIVNVHGFKDFSIYSRGVDYPIGLSQLKNTGLIENVVVAGDFYPGHIAYDNAHDLVLSSAFTEAVSSPEQPLFSAEFQSGRLSDRPRVSPNDVDIITRTCVAHGMNALNYYMYCGGDNQEGIGLFGRRHEWQAPIASNGELRPSYKTTAHLGKVFQAIGDRLCEYPKTVDTFIGFYPQYYMTETVNRSNPSVASVIQDIEVQREHNHFDGIWRLLVAANISFAAVDLTNPAPLSADNVPSLWVCSTQYMDADTQTKLLEYVKSGGRLIIGPRVPDKDLNGEPCRILADAFGLGQWSEKGGFQRVTVADIDSVFCRQYLVFESIRNAELIAYGEAGPDEVAAFVLPHGKGEVMVLGVALNHEYRYALDVIHKLAERMGVQPTVQVTDENLFVTERRGNDGALLFVNNVDELDRTTKVKLSGTDAFDGHDLSVPARTGLILPVGFHLANGLVLDYSTMEIVHLDVTPDITTIQFHVNQTGSGIAKFTVPENGQYEYASTLGEWKTDGRRAKLNISNVVSNQTCTVTVRKVQTNS